MKPELVTNSGRIINILNPKPEDFCLNDIAFGLSRQLRFNGLTVLPYTVAQHSVIVSKLCISPKAQLVAMLHDASEAYLHDLPTPLKTILPDYCKIETRFQDAIMEGILGGGFYETLQEAEEVDAEVKAADHTALVHEVNSIVLHPDAYGLEKLPEILVIQELRERRIQTVDGALAYYRKHFTAVEQALNLQHTA